MTTEVPIPINVCFMPRTGCLHIDFDIMLHVRGMDFSVYANTGYKPNNKDSRLLQTVLPRLFEDGTGITTVMVNNVYTLTVFHSHAFTTGSIKQLVVASLQKAGYDVTEVNESGDNAKPAPVRLWRRL